jgi:lysine N6-hydroxylase
MSHLDLAGIGAGPANLSLAALAEPINTLRCRFFERQDDLRWHPGLMLAGSVLQVSHLKDLVTLVDPTNRYTFLNFLARTGRLHRFASVRTQDVSRREFESYYRWAVRELDSVEAGCEVRGVTHSKGAFRVSTSRGAYTAQHVAVGVGSVPVVPESAEEHLGTTVFHSSTFVEHLEDLPGRRIVVIGGGQSGAEVVAHLLNLPQGQAVRSLIWATRRPGFPQLDDSAFANEWFQPDYIRYFHGLPEQRRRQLLVRQQMASDGVSASLLERIYQRLYESDFVDGAPLTYSVLPGRQLARLTASAGGHGWRVELTHADTGTPEAVSGDIVILATGYRFRLPDALLPVADRIPLSPDEQPFLAADYSASWDGPAGNKLFFLNAGRLSHGIADPNLSLASWRAAVVLNSLTGGAAYGAAHDPSSVSSWRPGPLTSTDIGEVPMAQIGGAA